jgi:hypothetical protein
MPNLSLPQFPYLQNENRIFKDVKMVIEELKKINVWKPFRIMIGNKQMLINVWFPKEDTEIRIWEMIPGSLTVRK